jgi:hypothetical protein
MPQGLKISTRYGTVLFFDSSWIAGVDYDNEQFKDGNYDDGEYEPYGHQDDNHDHNDNNDKEEYQDPMDPNEVADILQDRTQNAGVDAPPAGVDVPQEPPDFQKEEEEIVFEEQEDESQAEEESIATPAGEDPTSYETRSGRISRPTTRMNLYQAEQHLSHQKANVMCHWNNVCKHYNTTTLAMFIQTYSLNKGMKNFGQKGMDAAIKEMKQLHNRTVFEGIKVSHMTPLERKRAMESLLFLIEKRDGRIKARTCANGSMQREYIDREDVTSPKAVTESILITGVIEAKQQRDIMMNDVPNAFVQTLIPQDREKIIMKIRGQLVDLLLEIAPETYEPYIVYKANKAVLYVQMLRALYGMLIASILYYKKFCKDKIRRGPIQDYLAMKLDYSTPGVLKVDMREYISSMLDEFPYKLQGNVQVPWSEKLFKVDESSKKLEDTRRETF